MTIVHRNINESSILYELLVYQEWFQENDNLPKKFANTAQGPVFQNFISQLNPLRLWRKTQATFDVKSVLELPWKFAVSQDGMVAAVLQECLLEIRTAKDGYMSVIGKAIVHADQYPQLRRLCWSPDNTCLAVARDNGTVNVYNLFGSNLTTIHPENASDTLNPVVGLTFLQKKFKTTKWSSELLIVFFDGSVRTILLSALDCHATEENVRFSLAAHYPRGVSSVLYHPAHHMLIVAGYLCSRKATNKITAWRLLNDYPFMKESFASNEKFSTTRSSLSFFSISKKEESVVQRMKVSPNGRILACSHSDGAISLWTLPAIQLKRHWSLHEQPGFFVKPTLEGSEKTEKDFLPVDIEWWSDEAVVLVRKSGALSVCSMVTLENLLGEAPEHLFGPPTVASVRGEREGVLVLDCEVSVNYRHRSVSLDAGDVNQQLEDTEEEDETSVLQASIQAALYSVTDIERFQPKKKVPKFVQKTYRLLGLKTITPEELYNRKIDIGSYEDALTVARAYNLDCDLVYQRQWRMNPVSSYTINNYLSKVSKLLWVANECTQRVPDTLIAAYELLRFGLKVTNVPPTDEAKLNDLPIDKQHLISFRLKMLSYLDSLTLYEKILGSHEKYDSSEYDSLRKMEPLEAAVKFARDERCDAVSLMFTYRSDVLRPHWLPVISNFPETLRPTFYRNLLPRILGDEVVLWETSVLRDPDWVEDIADSVSNQSNNTNDTELYKEETSLRKFCSETLSIDLVEQWYNIRAHQIEEYTGSFENATMLIRLAKEMNVQNMDQLYNDLLTLEALVSVNENACLLMVESLSHSEQTKLLLGRSTTSTFVTDLKNLFLPFAKRCEENNCHKKFNLLHDLLLHFSTSTLKFTLELLSHLVEHTKCQINLTVTDKMSLALDSTYACSVLNELENAFAILECLPQRSKSIECTMEEEKLHNRLDILEKHLEVCDILQQNECPRSAQFVQDNILNKAVAEEIMESVANHANKVTLNFTDLIEDLLTMQQVFTCVDVEQCYEICAFSQMMCECEEVIQSADQYLSCWNGDTSKIIPFSRSLDLVLLAARTHFEHSLSCNDPALKLSETCLRLINEPHPEVCAELDLIEAIQLIGGFDVQILPLQVRITSDRTLLLEKCLQASPDAYKSSQRLIQLAHSLHLDEMDRLQCEGKVLCMVAKYAFDAEDYSYCSDVCTRLLIRNYAPSWTVLQSLGKCINFMDIKKRQQFLAFAILHCPLESIEELIEVRIQLADHVFQGLCESENL